MDKPDRYDKCMAACWAVLFMVFGAFAIFLVVTTAMALWQSGLANFLVLSGVLAGLFAIGRAIYVTILEKGFR